MPFTTKCFTRRPTFVWCVRVSVHGNKPIQKKEVRVSKMRERKTEVTGKIAVCDTSSCQKNLIIPIPNTRRKRSIVMPLNADKKKRLKEILADSRVKGVQRDLEQSVDQFMATIGDRIGRYKSGLGRALAQIEAQRKTTDLPESAQLATDAAAASLDPVKQEAARAAKDAEDRAKAMMGAVKASAEQPKPSTTTHSDPATTTTTVAEVPNTVDVVAVADETSADEVPIIALEFPNNTALLCELELIKKEAYEIASVLDAVTDWIALSIPEMKADNSNNVDVMGAVLEQISSLLDAVRSVYVLGKKYLAERAELEKGLLKVPICTGLALAVGIKDSDTWDDVERSWKALLRVSLIGHSILLKNMDQLKHPEGSTEGTGVLYQ